MAYKFYLTLFRAVIYLNSNFISIAVLEVGEQVGRRRRRKRNPNIVMHLWCIKNQVYVGVMYVEYKREKTSFSLFALCNFEILLLFTLLLRSKKAKSFVKSKVFQQKLFRLHTIAVFTNTFFCSFHSIISMLMTMMKIETYCNHVSHMEIPLSAQLSIQLWTWFRAKLLMGSNATRDAF